jgi:ELWxxDGT repeat protein
MRHIDYYIVVAILSPMLRKSLLFSSVAALLLQSVAARAESTIAAQPIDTAATVGNEQANFFLSRTRTSNEILTFSTNVKTITNKKGSFDMRELFTQRIEGFDRTDNLVTYTAVGTAAPLKRVAVYVIPAGGVLDDFLYSANDITTGGSQGLPEEFFHVPTHGLYFATGGGVPALVKAVTGTFNGYAMRQPDDEATDTDHSEAFRIVMQATDVKHGSEPYISEGPAHTTALLDDAITGAAGSNPRSFTTFLDPTATETIHTVYFLASASNGSTTVFRTYESDANPRVPKYGLTQFISGLTDNPLQILGGSDTLYIADATNLYVSDGNTFNVVSTGGTAPQDLVVNPESQYDTMGYSSVDSSSRRRFTIDYGADASASFTDATASIQDPTNIICTGDYYYYNATYFGGPCFIEDSQGDDTPQFVSDSSGYYLANVREMCFVHGSSFSGELYFVADELGGAADQLYKLDGNGGILAAQPVTTLAGHPVVGAHNLCSICNDDMFRLDFCAPINSTQNAEYLPTVKKGAPITDDGTKPFVTNEQ